MNRTVFLKKLMRIALLAILSLIVLALGRRIVIGADCSVCPGKDSCKGIADCYKM